jgi:hypothetical protein
MKQWNEIMHLRMDVSSNLHFILNDVVVLETTFYFTCCGSIENNNTMKLSTKNRLIDLYKSKVDLIGMEGVLNTKGLKPLCFTYQCCHNNFAHLDVVTDFISYNTNPM